MSEDNKQEAKLVNKSVVMDINGDTQNVDTDFSTGGSPVVVMIGGKPVLAGANHVESIDESEKETDKMLAENRNVRVTALPDGFDANEEEKVLFEKSSTEGPLDKTAAKEIKRIDTPESIQ